MHASLMNVRSVPGAVRQLLLQHGETYDAWYPPHDFVDHGPMAVLALCGLGADSRQIEAFHAQYVRRLRPLPDAALTLDDSTFRSAYGDPKAYPALRAYFARELTQLGISVALHHYLPELVSGWVKDAYHPLIRLGYGIEYGVASEIAAGLAALACNGPDPALETAVARPRLDVDTKNYLPAVAGLGLLPAGETFEARYRSVVDTGRFAPPRRSARPIPDITLAALTAFHATHDFFALHLVTGMHAFRHCLPWLPASSAELAAVGVAAGYAAIGSPNLEALPSADASFASIDLATLLRSGDEHDIKLAYSCQTHAVAFSDPRYDVVAARYVSETRST